jgi:Cu/Ag efflux protein CusF
MGDSRREILQRAAAFLIASVAASPALAGQALGTLEGSAGPDAGRHIRSYGEIEALDLRRATITILHIPLESPDKSFSMPVMRMVVHVTNSSRLAGLEVGDWVRFEAIRRKNAEMLVTNIKKIRLEGSRRDRFEIY